MACRTWLWQGEHYLFSVRFGHRDMTRPGTGRTYPAHGVVEQLPKRIIVPNPKGKSHMPGLDSEMHFSSPWPSPGGTFHGE